jgi:hypothetical protein
MVCVCVCSLCAVYVWLAVGNLGVALSVDATSRRCTALCFETLQKLHVHVEARLSLQPYFALIQGLLTFQTLQLVWVNRSRV